MQILPADFLLLFGQKRWSTFGSQKTLKYPPATVQIYIYAPLFLGQQLFYLLQNAQHKMEKLFCEF